MAQRLKERHLARMTEVEGGGGDSFRKKKGKRSHRGGTTHRARAHRARMRAKARQVNGKALGSVEEEEAAGNGGDERPSRRRSRTMSIKDVKKELTAMDTIIEHQHEAALRMHIRKNASVVRKPMRF